MNSFLFDQQDPFSRLDRVRQSLCALVIILLLLGPYDSFYVDTAPWLYSGNFNLGFHFWTLKYAVILFALCFGFGFAKRITGPLFALSFFFLNNYITHFGTTYWITNTHLNFFSIALCFTPSKKNREFASFLLAFMITYIAMLYFQAGISKLLLGGWSWFFDGKRIWTETLLLGTPFGVWLTQWPWIFRILGLGTALFELFVPFLFFSRKWQKPAAIIAILFHISTFFIMGISFWFLWTLFPALFKFTSYNTLCYSIRKSELENVRNA